MHYNGVCRRRRFVSKDHNAKAKRGTRMNVQWTVHMASIHLSLQGIGKIAWNENIALRHEEC